MSNAATYFVHAIKRDGTVIRGTYKWDGLADLVAVECEDGEVRYHSVLDRVIRKEVRS